MKTQHPAFGPIWVKNFNGAFHYGYQFSEKGGFKENVLPFLHTLALPFTLTFGVTIKTIIDVKSRHLLEKDQLSKLEETISKMDDETFDKKVTALYHYFPKSNSSKQLIRELWDEKQYELEKPTTIEAINRCIRNKNAAIEQGKLFQGKYKAEAEITQPDLAGLKTNRIANQKKYLLSFLDQPRNAGKKTQHVLSQLFNM